MATTMETLEDRYEGLMLSRTDPEKPSGRALRLLDICRELVVGVTRTPFVEGDGCLEDWDEVVRDFVLRYAAGIHVDLDEGEGHERRRKDAGGMITGIDGLTVPASHPHTGESLTPEERAILVEMQRAIAAAQERGAARLKALPPEAKSGTVAA